MKKSLLFFVSMCLFSLSADATPLLKTLNFRHHQWQGTIKQDGSRVCLKEDNCASIEKLTDDELILIWDKWGKDEFVYNPNLNIWQSKVSLENDARFQIQKQYEEAVYTFEEPFIVVNPFKKTPLSAMMKFETDEPMQITIRIQPKGQAPEIMHTFKGFNLQHELPILGLYPNDVTTVELEGKNKKGKIFKSTHKIQTGGSDYDAQWFVMKKKDKDFRYYANYDGVVFDETGCIRYQFQYGGWVLIYFYKDFVFVETKRSIQKWTLLGEFVKEYQYPKGFYGYMHGMNFKDNDNLLVFGTFEGTTALIDGEEMPTNRDIILELNAKTGDVEAKYDLAEMLNADRSLAIKSVFKDYGFVDWAHTNGIDYDAKNRAIIVSGRHFGMAKIDEKTKKPIWWLTPHQYIEKSGRKGDKGPLHHLMLTAVDEKGKPFSKSVQMGTKKANGFKWPLKSHSVKYAGSGYYSILDNSGSVFDKNLYTTENSVASVFYIDDKKKTVKQVFLKELPVYSEVGSSIIFNPQTKESLVSLSTVRSKNNFRLANSFIYRFNEKGDLIYQAAMQKGSNNGTYLFQPFEFYAKNNWPTPNENLKKKWFSFE